MTARTETPPTPSPGSHEAVALGCLCARIDNGYGRGYSTDSAGRPLYWITGDCPIHGTEPAA